MIELDVPNRRLHLDVTDAEIAARLADWSAAGGAARRATRCSTTGT